MSKHRPSAPAGPAGALGWAKQRPDQPPRPWTDTDALPTRADTVTDHRTRRIASTDAPTPLGRTLRLRATIAGRYGATPSQLANMRRHLAPSVKPYLDTAHDLTLNTVTLAACQRTGMDYDMNDGTTKAVADAIKATDAAAAWRYAAAYLYHDGTLPTDIAHALRTTHPMAWTEYQKNRQQIAHKIDDCAHYMTDKTDDGRRCASIHLRRLAESLAFVDEQRRIADGDNNKRRPPAPDGDDAQWEPIHIEKPKLTRANHARTGRTKVPTDTGRDPRYISRALTDPARRVFVRRGGFRYATVVLDLSGSMSLTSAQVAALIEAARGCTVLSYRTHWKRDADGQPLNAQLMARDGRTCEPSARMRSGGGNGCDGTALTYAHRLYRRHKAPLIWVSDGGITGTNEHSDHDLARDMVHRLKYTGAHHCYTVDDAIALLRAMRAGARPRPHIGARLLARLRDAD